MITVLIAFFISAIATACVIRYFRIHGIGADSDLSQPQKFHTKPTPRIGGVGYALGLMAVLVLSFLRDSANVNNYGLLLGSASLAFIAGLWEDMCKNVSPLRRLLATCASAALAAWWLGAVVQRVGFGWGDLALAMYPVAILFTVFVVGGMANAVNIIDGFNGLASAVSMMMFASMAYVALQLGDSFVMLICLANLGAILGFFVWNFPRGLIFLGDGGAYLLGFMLAECAVLLVHRNPEVSPWYVALLFIYPVFETLFSIYRKKHIRKMSPTVPDGVHLHMLIYKRVMRWTVGSKAVAHITWRNSMTAPYLWALSAMAVIPATIWWRHTWLLVSFVLVFCATYIWLYTTIVRFKAPKWLIWNR